MRALATGLSETRNNQQQETLIKDAPLSKEGMIQAFRFSEFLYKRRLEKSLDKIKKVTCDIEWNIEQMNGLLKKATENSIKEAVISTQEIQEKCTKILNIVEYKQDSGGGLSDMMNNKYEQIKNDKELIPNELSDLINNDDNCVIVCSNLRRAISTACIATKDRLFRNDRKERLIRKDSAKNGQDTQQFTPEKVYILSCLQELGQNYDTMPSSANAAPKLSSAEREADVLDLTTKLRLRQIYEKRLDSTYNLGDQSK
eukprot:UN28979